MKTPIHLQAVLSRFPEFEKEISDLLERDETFVEMCRDYQENADMLSFWMHIHSLSERQIRFQIEERRELLVELEQELRTMLVPFNRHELP